jgi:ComF family protein
LIDSRHIQGRAMHCQPQLLQQVYKWLEFDHICLLCDQFTDNTFALCKPCEAELPWLRERCQVCALPLALDGLVCGPCSRRRPAFEQVEAPWIYGFPMDSLITRFKHHAHWPLGRLLGKLLGQWLQHRFAEGLARPDGLMPVPMARRRLRQRGFNQAALLADWLATALAIRADHQALQRPRDTRAQQELSARARQRNLRQAFELAADARVEGLHIALVDDVLTTGATAQALARCLRDGGARRVDVYCLARTPKPGPT